METNFSLLYEMMTAISMEEAIQSRSPGTIEIDGAHNDTISLLERSSHDPPLEPEEDITPDEDRAGAPLYEGELPAVGDRWSPENMEGWMIGRLSRRIHSACISGPSVL